MLGVPVADRDLFTKCTAQATFSLAAPLLSPDAMERTNSASASLSDYFQRLIEERRASSGEDLLTTLIHAEEQGDKLTYDELISQCIGLLIAGFETTTGLIGNGVRALLSHPRELEKLQNAPDLLSQRQFRSYFAMMDRLY